VVTTAAVHGRKAKLQLRFASVYGPGKVFAVAQDHPHDESIGPQGARVLVGRKFAKG
jgi:hypothetical protein